MDWGMAATAQHQLQPGWTYWLTTVTGTRVRLDWSEHTTLWIQVPDDTAHSAPDGDRWRRVLDSDVIVEAGAPLTLRLEDATGNIEQWTCDPVRDLDRSSKDLLPRSVWANTDRAAAVERTAGSAHDIFDSDHLDQLRNDWPE